MSALRSPAMSAVTSAASTATAGSAARVLAAPPPPSVFELLAAARRGLTAAALADSSDERYASAHLAALRAAAAMLALRAARDSRHRGSRNVWVLLARHAPELSEWASFFSASAVKRAALEAGRRSVVTRRDADDLVRDAETFVGIVETLVDRDTHLL